MFLSLAACRGGDASNAAPGPTAVQVGRESVATAASEQIRTGPILSGQLAAERQATVRAEIGGTIIQMTIEEGQPVRKGQVVARIEARDLVDARSSAEIAVKAAEQALTVARNEAERTETLVKGGALAQRDLDAARNAVAAAESQLAAARARLASAAAQLANTIVRASIGGIVSDQAAKAGDGVTPGATILTIIDPSSMRLEASVPADQLGAIRVGAPVEFEVRGYPDQKFTGRIERISPAADPATRQVPIFVAIPNAGGRLIAGLFAEGRVSALAREALVVPASAVDATGPSPWVSRVTSGKVERVTVAIGIRDPDTEKVEITAGLNEGDVILLGAARKITAGTPVEIGTASRQ